MSTKRYKELKNLSADELSIRIRGIEGEIFQSRMKKSTGQLTNTSLIWRLRKDLARMRMLSSELSAKAGK